jgi:hypothetical protein
MSDDRIHEARNRAAFAKDLVENEMFNEAFDKLKEAYIGAMLATHPTDTRALQAFQQAAVSLDKIKGHFIAVINNGKLAEAELANLIKLEEAKKGRLWGS